MSEGRLYIIPTPIGNLEDLSPRARKALEEVEVLACEDTRHTRTIYEALGLKRPEKIVAYHEYNEKEASGGLVKLMREGKSVGLVSDAGTPLVSDPGYRVVRAAIDAGITVESLPGPSAAVVALAASGLPPSSFTFKGFAPKKPGARKRWLDLDKANPHTLILYESPVRIFQLLAEALEAYGDREACLARELTKKFEAYERGPLSKLIAAHQGEEEGKGEYVLLIHGLDGKTPDSEADS